MKNGHITLRRSRGALLAAAAGPAFLICTPLSLPASQAAVAGGTAPGASPGGQTARVAARDYYGDLRFRSSPLREQEILAGNCLNQRIKITVSSNFSAAWQIRESGRTSFWQGSVDPLSGVLKVEANGVIVKDENGVDLAGFAPLEASGHFAHFRIRFGPCGEGEVTVRN